MENPNAFPSPEIRSGGFGIREASEGMTLRDWFAGQAIGAVTEVCAHDTPRDAESMPQSFARKAYEIADAMLAARTQEITTC